MNADSVGCARHTDSFSTAKDANHAKTPCECHSRAGGNPGFFNHEGHEAHEELHRRFQLTTASFNRRGRKGSQRSPRRTNNHPLTTIFLPQISQIYADSIVNNQSSIINGKVPAPCLTPQSEIRNQVALSGARSNRKSPIINPEPLSPHALRPHQPAVVTESSMVILESSCRWFSLEIKLPLLFGRGIIGLLWLGFMVVRSQIAE